MSDTPRLGGRVRALRRREGLTQRQLAERLAISASYLNLIEHDRRPLSATLLIRQAQLFNLDLQAFAAEDDARVTADVMEVLGDPLFDELELTQGEVKDFVSQSPTVAKALLALYAGYRESRLSADDLAERVADDGSHTGSSMLPQEEVHDFIGRNGNYFPELEEAAERLWDEVLDDPMARYAGLQRHLAEAYGVSVRVVPTAGPSAPVRRFDPERRVLTLSEVLPPRSRHFQLAYQVGLVGHSKLFDRLVGGQRLSHPESRALARVSLANYFAGAVLMPYGSFHRAAEACRYDVELLGHRFRVSFEQVCHRLCTLGRPGAEGVPFHMLRVDIAGNISKRYSGSGIRFARFAGACPRWNVHAAFLTPGLIRRQVSVMPDGTSFFCVARTIQKSSGGYHGPKSIHAIGLGCELSHARRLIYVDGVDLDEGVVPVGTTCRLCPRMDCNQRALPAIQHPLKVDATTRGINFYAPVSGSTSGNG